MKFAISAIFTLALAMSVQGSVIPLGHHAEVAGHGLAYTAVSGPAHVAVHAPWAHVADPWAHGDWHGDDWHGDWHHGDWNHGDWNHGDWNHGDWNHGDWHGDWHGAWDGHHGHHGAVVVDHAVVVAPHHEGSYVAKTRGAVHTAPLAGHANSAAAINVAPAPGTV